MQETRYGFPVVTAKNCFDVVKECGIVPWEKVREVTLTDYLKAGGDEARATYEKFSPRVDVVYHLIPRQGKLFDGFRTTLKDYASVFALVDDMVPVTAEWKHGAGKITLVPPCGVPNKQENTIDDIAKRMQATAIREWKEETGFTLAKIEPLGPSQGIFEVVRNTHVRYFPFLGEIDMSIPQGPSKLDTTEYLKMILFPIHEWLLLLETPELFEGREEFCLEACARDITYLALRKDCRLHLNI
jgi:8-oxo-dGTP pyrophosphatase MutT (NUDIX family)